MVSAHRDGEDAESSDGYLSDGGDAVACRKRLHWESEGQHIKEQSRAVSKKHKVTENFISQVKDTTGLIVKAAGRAASGRSQSQCTHCNTTMLNMLQRWQCHAKKCQGLINKTSQTALIMAVTAGGDKHRLRCVDAYVTTYWVCENKLPFTTGEKLKKVTELSNVYYTIHVSFLSLYILHSRA